MGCAIKIKANGKDSELQVKLAKALNSEERAEAIMAKLAGTDFKERFGDWEAAGETGVIPSELAGRMLNLEPQLHKKKGTNQYYFELPGNVKFFINRKKMSDIPTQHHSEIILTLSKNYLASLKDQNNNTSKRSPEEVADSIDKTIAEYILSVQDSDYSQDIKDFRIDRANTVLRYKDDFVKEVITFVEDITGNYSSREYEGTIAEEGGTSEDDRGNNLGIGDSFEVNPLNSASTNVKIMLSQIEEVDKDGIALEGSYLGLPTFVELNEAYKTLLPALSDVVGYGNGELVVDVFDVMKERLKLVKGINWMESFIETLDGLSVDKKTEFVQAFSLAKINFYATEVDGKKYKVINATSTNSRESQIVSRWGNRFQNDFIKEGKITAEKKEELDAISLQWKKAYSQYDTDFKAAKKDTDLENTAHDVAMLSFIEMVTKLGVFTEIDGVSESINLDITDLYLDMNGTEEGKRDLIRSLFDSTKRIVADLKNPKNSVISKDGVFNNPLASQKDFVNLAKTIAVGSTDIADSNILANGGKSYYTYANPTYLSNKINEWKEDIRSKADDFTVPTLLEELGQDSYTDNSRWRQFLSASEITDKAKRRKESLERIEAFEQGLASTFKSRGLNDGSDNKDIDYVDAINDSFNKLLAQSIGGKSYFPTLLAADKSRKAEFTGLKMMKTKIQQNPKTGEILIPNSTISLFTGYFTDEYNRMKKVARELSSLPESELVVHYHTGAVNGLQSQLFPEFSANSNSDNFKALRESLYDSNGLPLTTAKGISEAQMVLLREAIKETLQERVQETADELNKITNKNEAIEKYYDAEYSNTGGIAVAGDYLVNGLISTIEYGKLFSGDPAYYKNTVDLIKRIPATYTDGQYLRITDADSLIFNQATVKGVEVTSRYVDKIKDSLTDKSIANAYEVDKDDEGGVNTTDAQAWITPRRWKFIKQRLGQWGPVHRSAFAAMESGRKMTEAELKVAAQPLKGVYFDMQNNGRPVYLKYSQAVLLPNLVKGTPMEALYNKMVGETSYDPRTKKTTYARNAKDEIHEVVTIDGVKVGAVAPTRINEPGTTNLKSEFELNTVQLSNRGWKLQQQLPTKKIHETNLGSQVQRTILSGMVMKGDYVIDGAPIKGKDLLKRFHDKVTELSNLGKERLITKFNIVDGQIQDMGALYDALIEDLRSKGGNSNIIQALEKETDFDAIPQIKSKVQSLFMAMMNKEVIKISTNGGSFIQVSPFGLESTKGESIITKTRVKKEASNNEVFELNEGQKQAKEDILNFLNDKTSKTMSLIGYAGTGKTTLLKEVFEEFDDPFTRTVFSSPTHKANAVIKKSNPDYNVRTLHSLLGLRADQSIEEFDATNLKFVKAESVNLDVLVIDESSMINDDLFDMITETYKNSKILFVGDDAQIRPVKQDTDSKALTSAEKTAKLTQVMRTNSNEVLDESMSVRNSGDFSYKNKTKNGIEFTNSNKDFLTEVYSQFTSDEYKKNPLHVRILAGSNNKVKYYNEAIRKAMFPGSTDIYQKGATLMAYSSYGVDYRTKEPLIQNSSDHTVVRRYEESEETVEGIVLKGRYIEIKDVAFDPTETSQYKGKINRVFALSEDNDFDAIGAKYEEIRLAALRAPSGQSASFWRRLAALKKSFVTHAPISHNGRVVIQKTFDSGYAHTVHKSQGSTYENVFVDENDIDNTFRDDKIKAQLKYVGVTRASNKATILTNKNIEQASAEELEQDNEVILADKKAKEEFIEVESETFIDANSSGIKIVSKNYDGKGLQPPRKSADGKTVLPGQIMMPHTDAAKLLKSLGLDITKMTGEEIMEKLDPSALEVMGYRIPNQGMSSNDYLEIVGILPEGMGDSMLVYDAIPGKTGSDFDIDKMFLMMNHLEIVNGKITKTQDKSSLEYKQNEMIALYKSVLSSPLTYDAMMTSIDGTQLRDDINFLFPKKELGNLELFSPMHQTKAKFEYASGAAGLGQVANQMMDHVVGQTLDLGLGIYLGKGTSGTNSKGNKYTTFDKVKDGSIANTLSAFLNAYVDIAKDPYISRGNHNSVTSSVGLMLVRAGYDMKWINRFLGQPILKELVKITKDSEGKTAEPLKDKNGNRVTPMEKLIEDKGLLPMISPEGPQFMETELENKIFEAREEGYVSDKEFDSKILATFELMNDMAKQLSSSIQASKPAVSGAGGNTMERLIAENKIASVNKTGAIRGFKSKFKNTALGAYTDNSVYWIGEVLNNSNLFMAGTKDMDATFNSASDLAGKGEFLLNSDFARVLDKSFYSYIISGTEAFSAKGTKENEFQDLIVNLPIAAKQARETNDTNNFFLSELQFNISKDGYEFITIDSKNKPKHYQDKIYNDWLSLYENEETKELSVQLVKYAFATSGFANNLGQFFSHIPHEILQDLNLPRDIVKAKREIGELAFDYDENYVDQTMRNNADDPKVVKRISLKQADVYNHKEYSQEQAFTLAQDLSDQSKPIRYITTRTKKGEILLYEYAGVDLGDVYADFAANGQQPLVYARVSKLGYKSSKGAIVEYAKGERYGQSTIPQNQLNDDMVAISGKIFSMYRNVFQSRPTAVKNETEIKLEFGDLFNEKDVSLSNEDIVKKNLDQILIDNNIKGNKDC